MVSHRMRVLRRVILGRRAVVSVIIALVSTVTVGYADSLLGVDVGIVPASVADWALRVVAVLAALQLATATTLLAARDIRRAFRARGPGAREVIRVRDQASMIRALRSASYIRLRRSPDTVRYVRNVWGYAGPCTLHLGMLVVMCGVLVASLTQSSGTFVAYEGESIPAGTVPASTERGPLASPPALTRPIMLDHLDVTYWPDGAPRRIAALVTLETADGGRELEVGVNDPGGVSGFRIFQHSTFGYAFGITVTRGGVGERYRFEIPVPAERDAASYLDTTLDSGDMLRAKLVHDPSTPTGAPLLTLRLVRGGVTLGEAEYAATSSAVLGDTEVSVDVVKRWAVFSLQRTRGMGLVFTGFFLIFAGAVLTYAFTPREVTISRSSAGGVVAEWHAVRFPLMYGSEVAALRRAAEADGDDDD